MTIINAPKYISWCVCILTLSAIASFATAGPVLRIEVGQHTSMINHLAVDNAAKLVATASDDKTVRLWNLPEGTLYTTLRVPIGEHLNGALYAVALSPDGKTLITAGETIDANQTYSLYVFDVAQRVLKARISSLPAAVNYLKYSADGKYFAAALASGYGIRIWDSQSGKPVGQDSEYGERSSWLDFNNAGNLASVSHDGYIRLYNPDYSLLKKIKPKAEGKPNSVAFSANGKLLAVGYANLAEIDILDLELNNVANLPVTGIKAGNAAVVNWQAGSDSALLAAGDFRAENGHFLIRSWPDIFADAKNFQDIAVSKNIVTDIVSLPSTAGNTLDTLYSSADPAWGGLKNARPVFSNHADLWDARLVELPEKTFAVSENGLSIAYSQQADGNDVAIFDVARLLMQTQDTAELLKTLSPAKKDSQQIKVSHWQRDVPQINGKPLDFDNYEKSYAIAINPGNDRLLVGTNYYLRWYDQQGKNLKKISVPAEVYAVNIAANGKLATAALGDGTLRWYSLEAGEELTELAALFPYKQSKDWIIWTKEGFFGSSDGGGYRLAGYHLNKGENKRPEWIDFSQVYQLYYAPELIVPKLTRQEDKIRERLKKIENADDRFNKNAVPIIELVKYCVNPKKVAEAAVNAQISGSTSGSWLESIQHFFQRLYDWIVNLFGKPTDATPNQPTLAENSSSPDDQQCFAIQGQGQQTRGFTRKEKVQTTVFRDQLAGNTESIELHYSVKPREGGLGDIDVFVNGQIQYSQKPKNLATQTPNEPAGTDYVQTIALRDGENAISVQAYEKTGGTAGVSNAIALINPPGTTGNQRSLATGEKSRLIILAVGIDNYQPPNELKYAVKDSNDFINTVVNKKSKLYGEAVPYTLFNEQATLANIEATFDKINATLRDNDSVLIYFSGHGLKDDKDFYFIPYGVDDNNLAETALSQGILKKNIAKLSKTNKVFIFMDSCHSGAVDLDGIQQEIASFDKIKHQLGDNIFVLAAAGENQEAQDQFRLENDAKADNGLFAYAVLEGLNGKARRMDDNVVDSFNLGSYVQRRIDMLTKHQTLYKQKARFQLLDAGDILDFDITQYE